MKKLHILKAGSFTATDGSTTAFTAKDLADIAAGTTRRRTRNSTETQNILEERVNKINGICSAMEEHIEDAIKIRSETGNTLNSVKNHEKELAVLLARSEDITNTLNQTQQNSKQIDEALASVRSQEEVIRTFSQEVASMQQKLAKQKVTIDEYEKQRLEYMEKRKEELEEASMLIQKARDVLQYKTAVGISAAFTERYNADKNNNNWLWLIGAGIFLGINIVIGFYLVFWKEAQTIIDLSRIAIMSSAFYGAWFCAGQYVKHKKIMEYYGYKAVLAKSMAGFSDQLDEEQKKHYLEIVLSEIHRDPMRKRHDVYDGPGQEILGILRKNPD